MLGPPLTPDEAEAFETIIVPRYLTFFAGMAVEMALVSSGARVLHLGCRTGWPDEELADRFSDGYVYGVDPSEHALERARRRTAHLTHGRIQYHPVAGLPTPFPAGAFSHAISLHPLGGPSERAALLAETARLLVPGGQAIIALPLRGSFPEVFDMLREFALRQDDADLTQAIEQAWAGRASVETISDELQQAGFAEPDVDVQLLAVSFPNGREFLEDPILRMLVLPEVRASLRAEPPVLDAATRYLYEAIGRYWSEGPFELTVNVGCASARRAM
jgi:SAM-dependent methyltransferase